MIKRASALAALLALAVPATAATGFREPVKVLWQHTGDSNRYYAWGVAPLQDLDRDGADEVLAGEPGVFGSDDPGWAWVQSGRTGRTIHRFEGKPGDQNGFSIVDAGDADLLYALPPSAAGQSFGTFFLAGVGDLNHDRVPDVYGGDYSAADNGANSGYAGIYSGRDGTLLRSWTGAAGDGLGPDRGAGDVNFDRVNDISIGSYLDSDGGLNAGKAELFSGRSGRKLRTITSTTPNENLGFDAVGIGDVNRDHKPDLLASAAEGDTLYVIAGTGRR